MKINFTKKQYLDLLLMSHIANDVLGIVGDNYAGEVIEPFCKQKSTFKDISNRTEKLEEFLISLASEFDSKDVVEKFEGHLLLRDSVYEKIQEIIDLYDEDVLFFELSRRLGQRDFYASLTKEELKKIENTDTGFPENIWNFYKKYDEEFENNGVERLFLNTEAKPRE